LMDPDRICKLRHILVNSPLISEQRLIEHGLDVTAEDMKNAALYEESMRSRKRKRRQDDDVTANPKLKQANANAGSREKQQELTKELTTAIDQRERREAGTTNVFEPFPSANGPIASRSSFLSPNIGNSPSSKINYILRKVRYV
jgi:hypothetical protein